jgi:hypothetical protein
MMNETHCCVRREQGGEKPKPCSERLIDQRADDRTAGSGITLPVSERET